MIRSLPARPFLLGLLVFLPAPRPGFAAPGEHGPGPGAASVVKLAVWKAAFVGEGVGFAVADDLIVTNRHVVYGAVRAEVVLTDRRRFDVAEVLATDRYWDLALLRIDAPPGTLTPLLLASELPTDLPVDVRSYVPLLLSRDFDDDGESMRPVETRHGAVTRHRPLERDGVLLRSDLAFEVGDSGTPMLDAAGARVVGVVTIVFVPIAGLPCSYAVPARHVRALVEGSDRDDPLADSLFEWQRSTMNDPEWMIEAALALQEDPRRGRQLMGCEIVEGLLREHGDDEPPTLPREAYFNDALCRLNEVDEVDEADEEAVDAALRRAAAALLATEEATPLAAFDDLVLSLAIYHRGACLVRLDEYDAAAALLDRYVLREPFDPDGHSLRTSIAVARGDRLAAERAVGALAGLLGEDADQVREHRELIEGLDRDE